MISAQDYFGPWFTHADATPERQATAFELLVRVNGLLARAETEGVTLDRNPCTGTLVSGNTFGGFRPQFCTEGAPGSSHKEGGGVDVYDPDGDLDGWITDEILEEFDLYREHPSATRGWCHLTTRRPRSGRRSFYP